MALTFVNQVGAPAGLNQAAPGSFIPENFVRWSQDVLFDQAGFLRRRTPFNVFKLYKEGTPPSEAYPSVDDERIINTVMTINPLGERVTGLVVGTTNSSRMLLYNKDFQAKYSGSSIISTADLDTLPQDCIYDCKQTSTGGMWLSFMDSYAAAEGSNDYYQYFWYGGYGKEQTITGVTFGTSGSGASMTYTNAITIPSGSFDTTTITSGMFVYVTISGNDYYVGTVKNVSASQLTLTKNILRFSNHTDISASTTYRSSLSIKLKNVRPYIHIHGRGLITRTSATGVISGNVGTDGEGHFKAADIIGSTFTGANGWALYRASDYAWLGDVKDDTATNDALTLDTVYSTSNVTYPMQAEEYVLVKYAPVPKTRTGTDRTSTDFAGIFNATYAGYQWYGNSVGTESRNRVVFSAYHDAEAVDLSSDAADSIIIPGMNEMRGLASSSAGLVVFLSNKTYIIRGNYRANFSLEELYPEGCLSSMSIVEYGGGVFWASKLGIMYFDGASVRNLTEENLGIFYTDGVRLYAPDSDRIYSFIHKNYLFLHFTAFKPMFNPVRYEPIYAESITSTPAIADFQANDWDPDFTVEDFDPANNVPIYWNAETLYQDAAFSNTLVPIWNEGNSFTNVTLNNSTTVSNISLTTLTGSADVSTDTITLNNHGLTNNTIIRFTSLGTVTNVTTNTVDYYVINATTNTFKISTSLGGSARDLTGTSSNISFIDTTPISVGMRVFNSYIPSGTTIASITNPSTIVLSAAATNSVSNQTIQITVNAPSYYWGDNTSQYTWGPARSTDGMTLAIYLPTNAITTLSNCGFRGATKIDSVSGLKSLMAANILINDTAYARLIDVDSFLSTSDDHALSLDEATIEIPGKTQANTITGPDFYIQTRNFTVGDPVLRKWFRQLFLNLYLVDGAVRLDLVDNEDNDQVDIEKKKHNVWDYFGERLYLWNDLEERIWPRKLSPDRSNWYNVESLNLNWYQTSDAAFERRKMKFSWRYPTLGFRLYQMNKFRPSNNQSSQQPHIVKIDSWNIGFKPMRQSRV